MSTKTPPPFKNRWLITGTLTTETELHIGDGFAEKLSLRNQECGKDHVADEDPLYQTVCTDHQGRAFIPSTSLRGPLRSAVIEAGAWDGVWEALFGSDKERLEKDPESAVGGKLIFYDAFYAGSLHQKVPPDDPSFPQWHPERRTSIATSVSLDRRKRTARENLLYQTEYIPVGEIFTVEIGGDNLTDEDVARLLALLERFKSTGLSPLTLGAQKSSNWGQVRWELQQISRFTRDDLPNWQSVWNSPLSPKEFSRLKNMAAGLALPSAEDMLEIQIHLQMTSPWLVGDAEQKDRLARAKKDKVEESKRPPGAVPVLDEKGRPFIPAKAVRGLLRTQAERILQTLGQQVPHPVDLPVISNKTSAAEALHDASQKLDLAAHLFGASGWRAPLQISAMKVEGETPALLTQEFVAIDRFTGGAADQLKFKASFAKPAFLTGHLRLDLRRASDVGASQSARGLLALLLRDLKEGDLTPGSHAAIGSGACTCTAEITDAGVSFESLEAWLACPSVTDSLASLRQPVSA